MSIWHNNTMECIVAIQSIQYTIYSSYTIMDSVQSPLDSKFATNSPGTILSVLIAPELGNCHSWIWYTNNYLKGGFTKIRKRHQWVAFPAILHSSESELHSSECRIIVSLNPFRLTSIIDCNHYNKDFLFLQTWLYDVHQPSDNGKKNR